MMTRRIITTVIGSLLSIFLIFAIARYAPDILQQDQQLGNQTENTAGIETTDTTETTANTAITEETTAPETKPTETEPPPSTQATKPQNGNNTEPTDPPIKPTQSSIQPQELPKWKQMYISQVTVWRTRYDHFSLVYIDGDDIPELYMYGNNQSELCVFRNDALYSLRMNGMGGGNYHKKSGHVLNVCAEGEYLAMYVYELTDVFRQTFYGREDKSVDPPVYYIGEYTGAVSEAEFKATVNQYIDTTKTEFLHKNAVTYDAFAAYITDF